MIFTSVWNLEHNFLAYYLSFCVPVLVTFNFVFWFHRKYNICDLPHQCIVSSLGASGQIVFVLQNTHFKVPQNAINCPIHCIRNTNSRNNIFNKSYYFLNVNWAKCGFVIYVRQSTETLSIINYYPL